jgi:hypothetical protein
MLAVDFVSPLSAGRLLSPVLSAATFDPDLWPVEISLAIFPQSNKPDTRRV